MKKIMKSEITSKGKHRDLIKGTKGHQKNQDINNKPKSDIIMVVLKTLIFVLIFNLLGMITGVGIQNYEIQFNSKLFFP